ncbi:MAG: hypothetical protein OHK0017_13250 [Patescibacteria group bacterium]
MSNEAVKILKRLRQETDRPILKELLVWGIPLSIVLYLADGFKDGNFAENATKFTAASVAVRLLLKQGRNRRSDISRNEKFQTLIEDKQITSEDFNYSYFELCRLLANERFRFSKINVEAFRYNEIAQSDLILTEESLNSALPEQNSRSIGKYYRYTGEIVNQSLFQINKIVQLTHRGLFNFKGTDRDKNFRDTLQRTNHTISNVFKSGAAAVVLQNVPHCQKMIEMLRRQGYVLFGDTISHSFPETGVYCNISQVTVINPRLNIIGMRAAMIPEEFVADYRHLDEGRLTDFGFVSNLLITITYQDQDGNIQEFELGNKQGSWASNPTMRGINNVQATETAVQQNSTDDFLNVCRINMFGEMSANDNRNPELYTLGSMLLWGGSKTETMKFGKEIQKFGGNLVLPCDEDGFLESTIDIHPVLNTYAHPLTLGAFTKKNESVSWDAVVLPREFWPGDLAAIEYNRNFNASIDTDQDVEMQNSESALS